MPGGERVYVKAFQTDVQTEFTACRKCGFLFQKTPLDQASLMTYYASSEQRRTRDLEDIDRDVFQQQIQFLAREIPEAPQHVLEIGPDTGTFLDVVRSRWNCETYYEEANQEACQILDTATPHLNVSSQDESALGGFDGIILRHILEHVPDPVHWLRSLAKRLSEKGVLFIEVPDWTLLDQDTGFISFEHVSYFTQGSLSQLLQRAGYAVVCQEMALNRTYANARHRVLRIIARPLSRDATESWLAAMEDHINAGKSQKYAQIDNLYADRNKEATPALYGASWLSDQVLKHSQLNSDRVVAIFDIDPKKHGTQLNGVPILSPDEVRTIAPSSILITSSSEEAIKRCLTELGYSGTVRTWSELGEGALASA